jgi:hypothetical protein
MKKIFRRQCPCCSEPFETNRSDKFYLNPQHQKRNNNCRQEKKRKKRNNMTKASIKTYEIYNDLLKDKSEFRKSKEFLRGRGANLALYTHAELLERKEVQFLFDIAVIDDGNYLILKRK